MHQDFLFDHHVVAAFYPVADAFAAGIDTDVVSLRDYRRATLLIFTGAVEDAAISNLVTFNACTDNAKTGATAMAWRRRFCLSSTTVDAWEALTAVAAAGYNFADRSDAGVNNAMWAGEVVAEEVSAALAGAAFVYATIAETADKTLTAGGIWILSEPRFPQEVPLTAIA